MDPANFVDLVIAHGDDHTISVETGEVVERDGFVFADLTLADGP